MENKFSEVMSSRTDEQLIKIVTIDRADYEPLAVETAENEIKIRNIDINKIEEVKEEYTHEKVKQQNIDTSRVKSLTRLVHFLIDSFLIYILAVIIAYVYALFNGDPNSMNFDSIIYINPLCD